MLWVTATTPWGIHLWQTDDVAIKPLMEAVRTELTFPSNWDANDEPWGLSCSSTKPEQYFAEDGSPLDGVIVHDTEPRGM